MKLLFITSPIGIIGQGKTKGVGGLELNLCNLAQAMIERGHYVQIVAPKGSKHPAFDIKEIEGVLEPLIVKAKHKASVSIQHNAVLTNMWAYATQVQEEYDLILNFGHEWLPFYISPLFKRPVLHFICLSASVSLIDQEINRIAECCPGTLGLHSKAQAASFGIADAFRILGCGLTLEKYRFRPNPTKNFAWAGRITPEKGLEDAVSFANTTGIPLKIFGLMQNEAYWEEICERFPAAPIEYMGFLPTDQFQKALGESRALIMTHKCVEAFGLVAIEAMACGTPVISYHRGGVAEVVVDGETGFLVEPDNIVALIGAANQLDSINRENCRQHIVKNYSMTVYGDRVERWFMDVLQDHGALV